jgi:hypothetical protein
LDWRLGKEIDFTPLPTPPRSDVGLRVAIAA